MDKQDNLDDKQDNRDSLEGILNEQFRKLHELDGATQLIRSMLLSRVTYFTIYYNITILYIMYNIILYIIIFMFIMIS